MNVDEMELAIYSEIDALQAEIKQRQAAIKELLTKLPYGYIIVRTFVKDYKYHARSGFIQYYNFLTYDWIKNKEKAYIFKSLQDAESEFEVLAESGSLILMSKNMKKYGF